MNETQDLVKSLQTFSVDRVQSVLVLVLLTWLIWPVLCGILGAKRGQGLAGVGHGLLWGPLGLIFVLMSRAKFACPTCGCKTLSRPMDTLPRRIFDLPVARIPSDDAAPPPINAIAESKRRVVPAWGDEESDIEHGVEQSRPRALSASHADTTGS